MRRYVRDANLPVPDRAQPPQVRRPDEPHIQGVWNVSIKGNRPQAMRKIEQESGHLTPFQEWRQDIGWQNRSASLIDLDEMIGGIVEGIEKLGVLNDTIFFFTSDVRHVRLVFSQLK